MKISNEDFKAMKSKYDKEVKKGKPAKGKKNADRTNQTSWIFLNRETLEGLLAKADKDPKVGGIQFYFTEYTEETARERYPDKADKYVGQMTLVTRAANLKENKIESVNLELKDGEYENPGVQCPYICDQETTDI
jgi:hypothetical protein